MSTSPAVSPLAEKKAPVTHGRGGPTDISHDDRLRRGIIDTDFSPGVAKMLAALFLLLIVTVPVGQVVLEKVRGEETMLLDIFKQAPTRESLKQFEDDLDKTSYPKDFVQPRVQALLSGLGGAGNSKAVIGRQGWLYYKPGITYLGGPGFLDPDTIKGRIRGALDAGEPPVNADPRPAIFAFRDALAKRGIKLVLFPVPDKAMLQPLQLHGRGDSSAPMPVPQSRDWQHFLQEMQAHDVAVFNALPAALAPGEVPRYLIQDTHWTPEWMDLVARDLAVFATRAGGLQPPAERPKLTAVAQEIERVGDVVDMLKLPEGQTIFAPQKVTVRQVQDAAGRPWEPDPKGDVLLLGDSFTNVFSLDSMGWGTSAGLAPHLALALGRAVDVIAQNDSGAHATRLALSREVTGSGDDRLTGKKVVIWEFASRELAVGDWKPAVWPGAPGVK